MRPVIRQRESTHFVEHDGKTLSISQLAKITGVGYQTLMLRFHDGLRGADLIRPTRAPREGKRDRSKQNAERRKNAPARSEVTVRRREAAREATERAKAEWAKEFAKPLISAKLLTNEEHREVCDRVKYSGQVQWRNKGIGGVL